MAHSKINALEQIANLQQQIAALQESALSELRDRRNALLQEVAELDQQIAEITGRPIEAKKEAKTTRTRSASISDEDLRQRVLKAFAEQGVNGLNMKQIGQIVGQSPIRIKKFITDNPEVLKRQGSGPATKFFLP